MALFRDSGNSVEMSNNLFPCVVFDLVFSLHCEPLSSDLEFVNIILTLN